VLSGPASGAIAAARIGEAAALPNLITCDMGGTSFDVSVIVDGAPAITRERSIDYAIPLRIPLIDIHTIGAGGGSLARITAGGMLQVGPQSAGADPGPICYGRGGSEPTVTDANLALGRINPQKITGVAAPTAIDDVRAAIGAKIGAPLGLDAITAAAGILEVANQAMADAIRYVSIERGFDPRDFAIFAFGGAGPLHGGALARALGVPTMLVPRFPGITSALGCVMADVRHDYGLSVSQSLAEVDGAWADAVLAQQAAEGRALIEREAVAVTGVDVHHEVDLLYHGQTHVMRMPVMSPGFDAAEVRTAFERFYRERFDVDLSEMRPMLAALRTTVIGRREPIAAANGTSSGGRRGASPTSLATRSVYFNGEWHDTPVFARESLVNGDQISGPAIVEQLDATTVLDPGDRARVDALGNLIIEIASDRGNIA
jgi:N-methylhydantoinase A